MVTKKIRTEYMKKFRDPKWETFSKCYEDSLKYRLSRRVMEHSHKPWFWEGCECGSDGSSGQSTPRLTRNRVAPLSLPPQRLCQLVAGPGPKPPPSEEAEVGAGEAAVQVAAVQDATPATENGVDEASSGPAAAPEAGGPSDDTATDNGPADTPSSDGEPATPVPPKRHRHRRRTPRSELGRGGGSPDDKPPAAEVQKPPLRAKSQPPIGTKEKENRRPSGRLDWTERRADVRTSPNDGHVAAAGLQTRRESDTRRSAVPDRRRARSADLEKARRSQLAVAVAVADDRWMTEYMRCFSARLR
ncbi:putative centriole cilia and spindle-associated protein-like [Scophthalmus maximus]|uniref:Putative centriole cilia and spindle-associated protein-like n=1 Tax=Scophthalmus maximus TaxID=52904 RepID=A0A2U9BLT7_SCOMX|nr:putative centriole cilia and spindle-associated protein-like [Scophthalmus maximus]